MENTVFERNYEIVEKDDRATAVFERAFAPVSYTHLDVYKRQVLGILFIVLSFPLARSSGWTRLKKSRMTVS